MIRPEYFIVLLLLTRYSGSSRYIKEKSDGIYSITNSTNVPEYKLRSTTVTCTPTYGFLPCTTEVWGELFLIVVYEYLVAIAQKYITTGSDLFFKEFGTGIFGASIFQLLGTIPQVAILIATAITGDADTVETLATMGVAMLAGSAVLSLTLIWGSSIIFGSYDLSQTSTSPALSTTSNQETNTRFSLTGFGITTDNSTKYTARIMLLSLIPLLILQLPKILDSTSGTTVSVIIALTIAVIFVVIYWIYQIFRPTIQTRRLEYLNQKYLPQSVLGNMTTFDGRLNQTGVKEIFQQLDQNHDGKITKQELQSLILVLHVQEVGFVQDNYVSDVMDSFDTSSDGGIDETEFIKGVTKWLGAKTESTDKQVTNKASTSKSTKEESQGLLSRIQETRGVQGTKGSTQGTKNVWWNYTKAAFLIAFGTTAMVVLGQPLMISIQDFATAIEIPSFFISYVVVPVAMSYSQAILVITSARKKNENTTSITVSEIYSGVFMNNLMGIATFLSLVLIKDLSWDVSAEILVVLIICLLVGLLASFITKFPYWIGIVAYLLYPISIALLYVLTEILGWT